MRMRACYIRDVLMLLNPRMSKTTDLVLLLTRNFSSFDLICKNKFCKNINGGALTPSLRLRRDTGTLI